MASTPSRTVISAPATPCMTPSRGPGSIRLVLDGLFVWSRTGTLVFQKKSHKGLINLATEVIEKYPVVPPTGHPIICSIQNYLAAITCLPSPSPPLIVIAFTKSAVRQDELSLVVDNLVHYFTILWPEKAHTSDTARALTNLWQSKIPDFDESIEDEVWSSYRRSTVDNAILRRCVQGEYHTPAVPSTAEPQPRDDCASETPREVKRKTTATRDATAPKNTSEKDFFQDDGPTGIIERIVDLPRQVSTSIENFAGRIFGGDQEITRSYTNQYMDAFTRLRAHLTARNVNPECAAAIVDMVENKLIGKIVNSWQGIGPILTRTATKVIESTLQGRKQVDIIQSCLRAKAEGRIYSIVFLGVNGVGKSTSLAKVAFRLREEGLKVLLIAGDSFRSGAIEQLKRHGQRLGLEIFDQGYGKDATMITKYGLIEARNKNYDVVLVDTAGRMQGNAPLMKQLSKLIEVNRPDLCMFVCEASVGNDGEDQLIKFNEALTMHGEGSSHGIDCLMLTKMDTVDNLVGVPLSLVHRTNIPVSILGTGQQYEDIQVMNTERIAAVLMSGFYV